MEHVVIAIIAFTAGVTATMLFMALKNKPDSEAQNRGGVVPGKTDRKEDVNQTT